MINDGTNVLKRVRNKQFNKFNKNNNSSSNGNWEEERGGRKKKDRDKGSEKNIRSNR